MSDPRELYQLSKALRTRAKGYEDFTVVILDDFELEYELAYNTYAALPSEQTTVSGLTNGFAVWHAVSTPLAIASNSTPHQCSKAGDQLVLGLCQLGMYDVCFTVRLWGVSKEEGAS